jgi:mRNA-degrading endonuclease RelE of RelBE toxin-antitoxin system
LPLNVWHNVKRLINHKYDYRLKVGNYRVVFDFEKKAKIISIEKIGVINEQSAYSRIENNKTLEKITQGLGVSLNQLD